jgi:hypothetical protein
MENASHKYRHAEGVARAMAFTRPWLRIVALPVAGDVTALRGRSIRPPAQFDSLGGGFLPSFLLEATLAPWELLPLEQTAATGSWSMQSAADLSPPCSETTLTGESRFHISTPREFEPGSLVTESKQIVHWTSETW